MGLALGLRISITSLVQRPPGPGQRITATQPSLDPETEAGVVSTSGTGDMDHRSEGLRPQGPGTPQRGSNNRGDGGKFLVSAELHGAMAPVFSGEQGCPLHPLDAENGRSRAPKE